MRRFWMIPTVLAVLGLIIGCGGGAETEQAAETAAETATETAAETPAPTEEAPTELASVNVEGKLGCGHCTFKAKDSCSLAMQTEDGTVYMLEAGDQQNELMDKRYDEPAVKIAGRVAEVDGQKIIYTDSIELF